MKNENSTFYRSAWRGRVRTGIQLDWEHSVSCLCWNYLVGNNDSFPNSDREKGINIAMATQSTSLT